MSCRSRLSCVSSLLFLVSILAISCPAQVDRGGFPGRVRPLRDHADPGRGRQTARGVGLLVDLERADRHTGPDVAVQGAPRQSWPTLQ